MGPIEYQLLAERTENKDFEGIKQRLSVTKTTRLIHAAQGLCTEAGEFTDTLKKHVFYGKELDDINLAEELGDIMWYIAEACNALGIRLDLVMHRNIAKLKARYPEKFEERDALRRNLDAERVILEGKECADAEDPRR